MANGVSVSSLALVTGGDESAATHAAETRVRRIRSNRVPLAAPYPPAIERNPQVGENMSTDERSCQAPMQLNAAQRWPLR